VPCARFEVPFGCVEGDVWRAVPVSYVVTERDYAVPRGFQVLMLGEVKGEGVEVTADVFDTSQCFSYACRGDGADCCGGGWGREVFGVIGLELYIVKYVLTEHEFQ
jgi:hypothetical protein